MPLYESSMIALKFEKKEDVIRCRKLGGHYEKSDYGEKNRHDTSFC